MTGLGDEAMHAPGRDEAVVKAVAQVIDELDNGSAALDALLDASRALDAHPDTLLELMSGADLDRLDVIAGRLAYLVAHLGSPAEESVGWAALYVQAAARNGLHARRSRPLAAAERSADASP